MHLFNEVNNMKQMESEVWQKKKIGFKQYWSQVLVFTFALREYCCEVSKEHRVSKQIFRATDAVSRR